MKRHSFLLVMMIAAMAAMGSCSDDLQSQPDSTSTAGLDEGELSEVSLSLSVNAFAVSTNSGTKASEPSDTPEEATADEKKIDNIWVFQYDVQTGNLLIKPRYYTITDQNTLDDLPVLLRTNWENESVIYVVANTGKEEWANDGTADSWEPFNTLTKLVENKLPESFPIQFGKETISIPMEGSDTTTVTKNNTITVPVARMYAKLKVKVNIAESLRDNMTLYNIDIQKIPEYCQIETMESDTNNDGEPDNATVFPAGMKFLSRAFATADDETEDDWWVIYVPENIQGEVAGASSKSSENAPDNALTIKVGTQYSGGYVYYTVYPGENSTNNFNIRRNRVYRVTVSIDYAAEQHEPSANCFAVEPGYLLAFEPYYREETGGGYSFSDYLDPDDTDKKIDKLEIIWQTKDCIGDNTRGDLVYLEEGDASLHQKIYVQTNSEGNALIAARNSNNDIIWSWHIWVTDLDPANVGNAVTYYTYDWNHEGINTSNRVSKNLVMKCNLGALADTPSGYDTKTFGMLYQWGRKDPFPPIRKNNSAHMEYNNNVTDTHYGNDNSTVVNKTSYGTETYLFHSAVGSNLNGAVKYSIAHPTVFICGTKEMMQNESYVSNNMSNYFNKGDWCPDGESDDKLWGGLEPSTADYTAMDYYTVDAAHDIHIFDNYGSEKSIFDPCPKGWRVAPGELWLGFTTTGLNPNINGDMSDINYVKEDSDGTYGMMMYMQAQKSGVTSYFPTQGTRVGDGGGIRVGTCGNYHNATTDLDNRVNILHIHNAAGLFKIFEYSYVMYYVKSTAGPIRCVRDSY